MVVPFQQQVDTTDNCQVMCNLFQDQIHLIHPLCKSFRVNNANSWNHILATLFASVLGKIGDPLPLIFLADHTLLQALILMVISYTCTFFK
jgi:hypothetical protein